MFHHIILIALVTLCYCSDKVKLRDVTSLTLRRGEYTSARRSKAVPQLKCIGGSAKCDFEPRVVQCYNRGYDGVDVQWECKAELRKDIEFGKIAISCEGYDYPDDPFILRGSCGLQYELEYRDEASHNQHQETPYTKKERSGEGWSIGEKLIIVAIASFVVYVIFSSITSGQRGRGSNGGFSGFPPFPGSGPDRRGPPPPGFKKDNFTPPPSYEETCNRSGFGGSSTAHQQGSTSGPGFFSGLGLGALAGYAFGSSRNNDGVFFRHRGPSGYSRSEDYFSEGPSTSRRRSPSPSSSETRVSSGFGGTVRR